MLTILVLLLFIAAPRCSPFALRTYANCNRPTWNLKSILKASAALDEESIAVTRETITSRDTGSFSFVEEERAKNKQLLLGILNPKPSVDAVLADPVSKEPIIMTPKAGLYFGSFSGASARRTYYEMRGSANRSKNVFAGSSDTFFDLLEPFNNTRTDSAYFVQEEARDRLVRNLVPLLPPPLRSALAISGVLVGYDYVPMRDLFTSPAVSYAYERGWRQGFRSAGFPGDDEEARMAMDYFAPSITAANSSVLVDMSCATGLFTRRFATSGKYSRVLGCDYSDSMLNEARRRIQSDRQLRNLKGTRLDLVRLDVGQIPMQTNSVDALHAGAAMHCWPDLDAAASEIYRVLKPGGRYFATTFLSGWFQVAHNVEGGATGPSRQAFQYFKSSDVLRSLMERGGFSPEKITVEVLQPSCVVIRCEK